MYRILFLFTLLFCPICAIGQKPDTVVVKYSADAHKDWNPDRHRITFRPHIVAADRDWEAHINRLRREKYGDSIQSVKSIVDTLIRGYRVNVITYGKQSNIYSMPYRVNVLPVDTTTVEWWHVSGMGRSERMTSEMRKEGLFYGCKTSRHNEVVRRMDRLMGLTNWSKASWLQFVIGRKGFVRSYIVQLDSAAYHKIAIDDFVRLIDTLNTKPPFIDWQSIFPEDTLPAVHYQYIVPRYIK